MIKNRILQNKRPIEKICYFIGICLLSKVLFLSISTLLCSFLFDVNLLDIDSLMQTNNNSSIRSQKLAILLDQVGTFFIPTILFVQLIYSKPIDFLFIKKLNNSFILLLPPLFAILFIGSYFLLQFNQNIDLSFLPNNLESTIKNNQIIRDKMHNSFIGPSIKSFGFNVFLMAVIPAFCEEIAFRGLLQNLCSKWTKNIHAGILLSGLVFAVLHFQFYNFIALLFIGFSLGYIVAITGNLWVSIIIHFLYNFSSLLYIYLYKNNSIDDQNLINEPSMIHLFIFILCFVFVFYLLKGNNQFIKTKQFYINEK